MSRIYQPPGQPFDPIYIDCLANALARRNLNFSTQSIVLVDIVTIPLVANLFDTDGKILKIDVEGNYIPAGGSAMDFRPSFDGVAMNPVPGGVELRATTTFAGNAFLQKAINIYRRGTALIVDYLINLRQSSGTTSAMLYFGEQFSVTPVDFSLAHSFTLRGRVENAADTITLFNLSATVV